MMIIIIIIIIITTTTTATTAKCRPLRRKEEIPNGKAETPSRVEASR